MPINTSINLKLELLKQLSLAIPPLKKGYLLYDINTRKTFVSRHVTFDEYVFPFQSKSGLPSSTFINSTPHLLLPIIHIQQQIKHLPFQLIFHLLTILMLHLLIILTLLPLKILTLILQLLLHNNILNQPATPQLLLVHLILPLLLLMNQSIHLYQHLIPFHLSPEYLKELTNHLLNSKTITTLCQNHLSIMFIIPSLKIHQLF